MKELAKELAPLVTSAMRNTKVDWRGMEKAFRSQETIAVKWQNEREKLKQNA